MSIFILLKKNLPFYDNSNIVILWCFYRIVNTFITGIFPWYCEINNYMFISFVSYKDSSVFHIYSCLDESLHPASLLKLQVSETINFVMAPLWTVYEAVD